MAERARQAALLDELPSGHFLNPGGKHLSAILGEVVDPFGGALVDESEHLHLFHTSVGSRANDDASGPHVGKHEWLQLWIIAKKVLGHCSVASKNPE